MALIQFIRDEILIDDEILKLKVNPGDTVLFGAKLIEIKMGKNVDLLPGCNIILIADVLLSGNVSVAPTPENRSPSVTIVARQIRNPKEHKPHTPTDNQDKIIDNWGREIKLPKQTPLVVKSRGLDGKEGTPGVAGYQYYKKNEANPEKDPVLIKHPAKDGGPGQKGSPGGPVIVCYVEANIQPKLESTGGRGGKGGAADNGESLHGVTILPALAGKDGKDGAPGKVENLKVNSPQDLFARIKNINSTFADKWLDYICEVAIYNFRCFNNQSIIKAINQFEAVLNYKPNHTNALTYYHRVLCGQTPRGLSRDVDIAPDYIGLSIGLSDFCTQVQNVFDDANLETITSQIAASLNGILEAGKTRTKADLDYAQKSLNIVKIEKDAADLRIKSIQNQITAIENQKFEFSIWDIASTVGIVASAIFSIGTGIAAIISIPASLAALGKMASTSVGFIDFMKQKDLGKDLSQLGQGIQGVVKTKEGIINFIKVIQDIEDASSTEGQEDASALLKELTKAVWEKMVVDLKVQQADDYVKTLQPIIDLYEDVQSQIGGQIQNNLTFASLLLKQARIMASQLSEEVFLAVRALEIYQLIMYEPDAPVVRFDYGYIHPDKEQGPICFPIPDRTHDIITLSNITLNDLPTNLQTWNAIYAWTNCAQVDFDVVHPVYSILIPDEETNSISINDLRASLMPGNALRFSVDLDELGNEYFEVKIDGMELMLIGASTTPLNIIHFWIQHTGNYVMKSRLTKKEVYFYLSGRNEVCNFKNSVNPNGLTCNIPYQTQSNTEPGPPFSFWGRGIAAEWILFNSDPNQQYDVSNLSQVNITMVGLAFAKPISPPRKKAKLPLKIKNIKMQLIRNFKSNKIH